MKPQIQKETEVFGVTYDRYVMFQLHGILTKQLDLNSIVEMPSHGAKAAGSLYSIGFASAGCNVTLVNPEMEMMGEWEKLGLQDKVKTFEDVNVYKTEFGDNEFDLAFNFVTWTELDDPPGFLREMKRIARHVLLITCNNFQPGYPWHRFLHAIYGFEWNHGQVEYNHITRVKKLFKQNGMEIIEYGTIDTPGWPDPSGPRDVRLHRRFGNGRGKILKEKPVWEVPFLEYVRTENYPKWMKAIGKYDMLLRRGLIKLFLSHLFYIVGQKNITR